MRGKRRRESKVGGPPTRLECPFHPLPPLERRSFGSQPPVRLPPKGSQRVNSYSFWPWKREEEEAGCNYFYYSAVLLQPLSLLCFLLPQERKGKVFQSIEVAFLLRCGVSILLIRRKRGPNSKFRCWLLIVWAEKIFMKLGAPNVFSSVEGLFYPCVFDPSTSILHFDFTFVFVRNFWRPDRRRAFFANIQIFFSSAACPNIFADIWEVGRAASFFSFFCEADLCLGEIFTVVSLSVRPSRAFVCMKMELKVEVWKSQKNTRMFCSRWRALKGNRNICRISRRISGF